MNKIITAVMLAFVGLCAFAIAGCAQPTGTTPSAPTRIMCYSGGELILADYALGSVTPTAGRLRYRSETTGQKIWVGGDCIVQPNPSRLPGHVIKLPDLRR